MKTISISGVIGWDIIPDDIRAALEAAAGEDVDIQVSSPGGFVTEGLEIYNLVRNYQGHKQTHLMGMAASMASYIVMAGDRVIAEDNAIFMVHNVWASAMGDKHVLRKAADIIESLSDLIGRAYTAKSGKSSSEIQAMMDEETFLFGNEILDAGFVDEIVPSGEGAEDKAAAVAKARSAVAACMSDPRFQDQGDTLLKAAALLPGMGVDPTAAQPLTGWTPEELVFARDKGHLDIETIRKYGPKN